MKSEIIDCTPNWEGTLNMLIVLLKDGDAQGQKTAREELIKMARLADKYVNAKSLLEDILLDYKTTWDADDENSSTAKTVKRIESTLNPQQ